MGEGESHLLQCVQSLFPDSACGAERDSVIPHRVSGCPQQLEKLLMLLLLFLDLYIMVGVRTVSDFHHLHV
jgi:hypothetical protein